MPRFPSVEWFQALADRMEAQPEKYRRLGHVDLTLVPRITFPDGREAVFRLVFAGPHCRTVDAPPTVAAVRGPHPVVIEGEYTAWREMIESIRTHGQADLKHTLNFLTLPDWPFRLDALDPEAGQLDVDRFYRYMATLQAFFDEAASVETEFVAEPSVAA